MSSEYTPNTEAVREQYTQEQPPQIGTFSEKAAEFDRWLAGELAAAEKRGAVRVLREAAEMLEDAANLYVHPARQFASEALHIAQRRLEHRADRLEEN